MKLVDDARDWSKWWSVRLSILGGTLLTILEGFPHAVTNILNALSPTISGTIDESILKGIGLVCIIASPVARVLKQSRLDDKRTSAD